MVYPNDGIVFDRSARFEDLNEGNQLRKQANDELLGVGPRSGLARLCAARRLVTKARRISTSSPALNFGRKIGNQSREVREVREMWWRLTVRTLTQSVRTPAHSQSPGKHV